MRGTSILLIISGPLIALLVIFLTLGSGVYLLLSIQLCRGLRALASQKPQLAPELPLISILVAARDEEKQLAHLLGDLVNQNYPKEKWEVIVADDRSTDSTPQILEAWRLRFSGRLKVARIESKPPGVGAKKHALSEGLKMAHGEIIVTTDADCRMNPGWLTALVNNFDSQTGLVLGLTTYTTVSEAPKWASIAALEFASYAFVAASLVGLKFPVLGNANNIAYRRKAYDEHARLDSHAHWVSGDDDFLLQGIHASGKWSIAYATSSESAVTTSPPESLQQLWEQRKRWASKCGHYQTKQVVFLTGIFSFYIAIAISILLGLWQLPLAICGVIAFLIKTSCDYQVMRFGSKIFSQQKLMKAFLPTALIHIPLIVAAVIGGNWGSFVWKGERSGAKAN